MTLVTSTMTASESTASLIGQAVGILRRGGLVAFPTETVYGLGADAQNPEALARLYAVKGRPSNHPVIVHLAHAEQLSNWADQVPPEAMALAQAFWPGPLTLILHAATHVLPQVTGGHPTVGLRVPSHPMALNLLQAFEGGIAAPSANRFGHISPTTAAHVASDLGTDVDLILDGGPCTVGLESTILDLSQAVPTLLRPGMISKAAIEAVLGQSILTLDARDTAPKRTSQAAPTPAPGTLAQHYAPQAPLFVLSSESLMATVKADSEQNRTVGVLSFSSKPPALPVFIEWITIAAVPEAYAQALYRHLRQLDAPQCQAIYVEAVPMDPTWVAIVDRLTRATCIQNVNEEVPHVQFP